MKKLIGWTALLSLILWTSVRIYYQVTDGFLEKNILSSFVYHPSWEVRSPREQEEKELQKALSQPFFYLGKGCQSYVFRSDDGKYVIKFFKLQRYRLSPLLKLLPPLPFFQAYKERKKRKKEAKRDRFFQSWKLAYNDLPEESGLIYVHLNPTDHLRTSPRFYDKLGRMHLLPLDQMVFLVQKRATPLSDFVSQWDLEKDREEASLFCDRILKLLISEYERGYFDADPALVQNTGVLEGRPMHIDIGQWTRREDINTPDQYKQDLYDRLHGLHLLLKEKQPLLAEGLETSFFLATQTRWETMHPSQVCCY